LTRWPTRLASWTGRVSGMIWPQSGDSVDLLSTDEKLQGWRCWPRRLATSARPCAWRAGQGHGGHARLRQAREKLAPAAMISRPRTPAGRRTTAPVLACAGGRREAARDPPDHRGRRVQGAGPLVQLLVEMAREFPHFGYVKEEAAAVIRAHGPCGGPPAHPARVQRPRRAWVALRVAARHRGLIPTGRLRGPRHPHLAAPAGPLGRRRPQRRLQQVPPDDKPGPDHPGGELRGAHLYLWRSGGVFRNMVSRHYGPGNTIPAKPIFSS